MRHWTLGLLLGVAACANVQYPVSIGSHEPTDFAFWMSKHRIAVVTDNSSVARAVTDFYRRTNHELIETAQVNRALNAEGLRLPLGSDDELKLLEAGKALRADVLIVADVGIANARQSSGLEVLVRAVRVDTGQLLWRGGAYWPYMVSNDSPDTALRRLTLYAIAHATCRTQAGYVWIEASAESAAQGTAGCLTAKEVERLGNPAPTGPAPDKPG